MSIPTSVTATERHPPSELPAVAVAPLRNPTGGESARKRQKISHACELCESLRIALQGL